MQRTQRWIHSTDAEVSLAERYARLGVLPGQRVLNVACEDRLVPPTLANMLSKNDVEGIDLHVAPGTPHMTACDIDRQPLPFADASFDVVLSVWGFEHFATPRVVAESARVLKSQGSLVVLTPNRRHPVFALNRLFGGRLSGWAYKRVLKSEYHPHPTHYRLNTGPTLAALAERAGFSTCDITYLGPAHLKYYVGKSHLRRWLFNAWESLTNNRLLFRWKPYVLVVCTR